MFKVLCSITNSFCASASSATQPGTAKELATADSDQNKNSKYFSELKTLYILGKEYAQPIGKWKEFSVDKIVLKQFAFDSRRKRNQRRCDEPHLVHV